MSKQKYLKRTDKIGFWHSNRETIIAQVVGVIVGALIGALITWLISLHYYVKSSEDLLRETQLLKITNGDMLRETKRSKDFILTQIRLLQAAHLINVKWKNGEPEDIVVGSVDGILPAVTGSINGPANPLTKSNGNQ